MGQKKLPGLNHVLLQLVLRRLFLPLLIVWIAAIGGAGYFLLQNLCYQQQQAVKSMAQMVDRHLDQGGRILDAVARVSERKAAEDMAAFIQGTWEAYKHFDTIYYLDENKKIVLMVPSDPMYLGLDMSNLPDFQYNGELNSVTISRPFISLRTGNPTVYLIRPLARGGCVVGELSLGAIQHEIASERAASIKNSFYILDQSGMLLAHPISDLVKQQTNMSYVEIFRQGLNGDATLIYNYEGTKFLGNATRVNRVGWVIVDQISLSELFGPYAMTFGITFLVTLGICLTLMWNLRKQLQRNVIAPLVQLSHSTDALAIEDYNKVSVLASMPTAFAELNRLAHDFRRMSGTLEARQAALRESEERYRCLFEQLEIRVQERTAALAEANHALKRLENLNLIGEMAASIGHEVRNPLTTVRGYLQFLSSKEQLISHQEIFQVMISELDRANGIITEFLALAKNKAVHLDKRSLNSIIEAIYPLLQADAIASNKNITLELAEHLPVSYLDKSEIRQLVINLVRNGLEAMTDGGMISIRTYADDSYVVLSIQDQGKGIPDSIIRNIGTPFFTTKENGTGLGLSVCYSIASRHKASIDFETGNHGTKFIVKFQRADSL